MSSHDTIVVAIAGGHASGKKSGANIMREELINKFSDITLNIKTIDMEYYMTPIENRLGSREPKQYNFTQIKKDLEMLILSDQYDVIILYGLYALFDTSIVNMATVRVFIDCDPDVRLGRWIKRDVLLDYNGKSDEEVEYLKIVEKEKLEQLLNSYLSYSRQEMKLYIQDTKDKADVILPKGSDISGFTLIIDGLQSLLLQRLDNSTSNSNLQDSRTLSNRSYSTSSINRETVINSIKMLSQEPSVMSLNNDNFSNENKIFYDVN